MRATINLPDALAEAAKARTPAERRMFTSLVEEGLWIVLDRAEAPVVTEPRQFRTVLDVEGVQ